MEGITAFEDLQVTRFQSQRVHASSIAIKHCGVSLVFIGWRAQVGAVAEKATGITVPDRQGDGVVVGVEMPGKPPPGSTTLIDHAPGIIVPEEMLLLQGCLNEGREVRRFVNRAQHGVRPEVIGRTKALDRS